MIDIENQVFTSIANDLRTAISGINVQGTVTDTPSKFPAVFIEEIDNYVVATTQDSSHTENHSVVTYEVNVFSNKNTGAKTECKTIFSRIDSVMSSLGFTRTQKVAIRVEPPMRYRLVGRYSAVVGTDEKIYRR